MDSLFSLSPIIHSKTIVVILYKGRETIMSISRNVNPISRRTTAVDAREMEELLPPILRAYGAIDAKDGDSIDVLDGIHFMGLVCSRVYKV